MQRCLQCNSTLRRDEKVCYSCNTAAPEKNPKKPLTDRLRIVINAVFILFAVLTVAALVTGMLPFWKCFAGLAVLYLVKNSADNMAEFPKEP